MKEREESKRNGKRKRKRKREARENGGEKEELVSGEFPSLSR